MLQPRLESPTRAARNSDAAPDRPQSIVAPSVTNGHTPARTAGVDPALAVAVLVLARLKPRWAVWGWWQVVRGGRALARASGARFAKALGSGYDGGFGLRPSATRQGLFLVFDGAEAAERFIAHSPLMAACRARTDELLVARLAATSCRGRWSGFEMPTRPQRAEEREGPVAALTRASIRPARAAAFWRLSPAAQAALSQAPGCRLAVGLGEAPLLRQATFSLWDSVAAMDAYARQGAHRQAIEASMRGSHFSESMFVRFAPLSVSGTWQGRRHG